MKLKKKELLALPYRKFIDEQKRYSEIYIIPGGTKHDSGYMHIAVIGKWIEDGKEKYEITGYPDSISYFFPIFKIAEEIEIATVRQDCYYPQGILRFFGRGEFTVEGISSVDIKFFPTNPNN